MGFLKRLFGDQTETTRTTPSPPDDRPAWMTDSVEVTLCDGINMMVVPTESYFQDELRRIVKQEGRDVAGILAPEGDGHDSNAVSVWVFGLKVGYLDLADVHKYRTGIQRLMEDKGRPVALKGHITGGESGQPIFGMWMEYDHADFVVTQGDPRWRERIPSDQLAAIKYLRDTLDTEDTALDRHFLYLELEKLLYKSRNVFASALDQYREAAEWHDDEMGLIRPALMAEFGGIPSLPTYRQMAIVEQKEHDYEAALDWAKRGLALYGNDALADDNVEDLKVRIGTYEKKLGR